MRKSTIILIIIFLFNCVQLSSVNQLIKAFWHLGDKRDNLAFYFNADPVIKLFSKKNIGNFIQEIYSITHTKISQNSDILEVLKKINKFKHPFYRVNVYEKEGSIYVKIIYDNRYVSNIIPLSYNAISAFKGINFSISHKHLKDHLKNIDLPHGKINDKQKPNVILDFGHGGIDSGAIGTNNVCEKEITLCVGMKLKKILETNNYNVFLTRNGDYFLPLDQRTTMANFLEKPSVFVSIHANHSHNNKANGVETFYADSSLLNKHSFKDNKTIISPVVNKSKDEKNKLFASIIHENVYKTCKEVNNDLIDRKLKRSISQILLGTEMPTALVEIGFISNKDECKSLNDSKYQNCIARGIFKGINQYFNQERI